MKRFYCWNSDSIDLYGTVQEGSIADSVLESIFEAFFRGMDHFCHGDYLYKMYSLPCGSMRAIKINRIPLRYADRPSCYMYDGFWQPVFSGFFYGGN